MKMPLHSKEGTRIKPGRPHPGGQPRGNPVNFNQCHFKSCAHLEILSANVVSCVIEVKNKFKAIPLDFFGISFALDYSTIFIFSVGAYIHMWKAYFKSKYTLPRLVTRERLILDFWLISLRANQTSIKRCLCITHNWFAFIIFYFQYSGTKLYSISDY